MLFIIFSLVPLDWHSCFISARVAKFIRSVGRYHVWTLPGPRVPTIALRHWIPEGAWEHLLFKAVPGLLDLELISGSAKARWVGTCMGLGNTS